MPPHGCRARSWAMMRRDTVAAVRYVARACTGHQIFEDQASSLSRMFNDEGSCASSKSCAGRCRCRERSGVLVASTIAVSGACRLVTWCGMVTRRHLVSSMLSALPAWPMIDPLPVLPPQPPESPGKGKREKDEPEGSDCSTEGAPADANDHPPGGTARWRPTQTTAATRAVPPDADSAVETQRPEA